MDKIPRETIERIKKRVISKIKSGRVTLGERKLSKDFVRRKRLKEKCCAGKYNTLLEKLDKIEESLILVEDLPLFEATWSQVYPKTREERRELYKKRKDCFLYYDRENDLPKFPVCDKKGKFWCQGALAAFRRARQYGYENVAKKALRVAKKQKCDWALEH